MNSRSVTDLCLRDSQYQIKLLFEILMTFLMHCFDVNVQSILWWIVSATVLALRLLSFMNWFNMPSQAMFLLKVVFSKPSGYCIVAPIFFFFFELETLNFGYLLIFEFCLTVQSFRKIEQHWYYTFLRVPPLNFW